MGKRVYTYKPSRLLDTAENECIRYLTGERCESLATTPVQLYATEEPSHNRWIKIDSGILCFVRDHNYKSYFFRLYQLESKFKIWEHEMYKNFNFNKATSFLHTFEGEEGQIAFNYTDTREADEFYKTVQFRITSKLKGKTSAPTPTQNVVKYGSSVLTSTYSPPIKFQNTNNVYAMESREACTEKKKDKNKTKNIKIKLNKADIGNPIHFQHVGHVGWNIQTGFDLKIDDPDIKSLFQKAGLTQSQLEDPEIKHVVQSFIQNHGGIDEVRNQYRASYSQDLETPSPPQRTQAPSYGTLNRNMSTNYGNERPTINNNGPKNYGNERPIINRSTSRNYGNEGPIVNKNIPTNYGKRTPQLPTYTLPRVPSVMRPPINMSNYNRAPPVPPLPPPHVELTHISKNVAPPPPLLPLNICYPSRPPLPDSPDSKSPGIIHEAFNDVYQTNERSDFLESIRNRGMHTQKEIPPPPPPPNVSLTNNSGGERNDFLGEIHKGFQLKPVKKTLPAATPVLQKTLPAATPVLQKTLPAAIPNDNHTDNNGGERNDFLSQIHKGFKLKPVQESTDKPKSEDLASVLAKVIANRGKSIQCDDDDDSSNDEDWDD